MAETVVPDAWLLLSNNLPDDCDSLRISAEWNSVRILFSFRLLLYNDAPSLPTSTSLGGLLQQRVKYAICTKSLRIVQAEAHQKLKLVGLVLGRSVLGGDPFHSADLAV